VWGALALMRRSAGLHVAGCSGRAASQSNVARSRREAETAREALSFVGPEAAFANVCEYDVDRWQRQFLKALRRDDEGVQSSRPMRQMVSSRAGRPAILYPGPLRGPKESRH
jgi:hypothetical protein